MKLFDNCIIQAPDGEPLSRCSRRRVDWYISQGLADLVAEEPPTVRLKFEPRGRDGLDDPLLPEGKPNLCVVCGTTENLTRHHILPYCFVRYLPLKWKVGVVRDIFALCVTCHTEYERKSWVKRKEIAERMGIPLYGVPVEVSSKLRKARGAAAALLKHKEKIPAERQEFLLQQVKDFLEVTEVTEEILRNMNKETVRNQDDYVLFSKHVVEHIIDYQTFAQEWRTHFVETMNPIHMPKAWKVDRKTSGWIPHRMLCQLPDAQAL